MLAMTDERSRRIQVLRGLAIASVVLIHNTPLGLCQVWCRPFLNWSVGLFLFLSGLLSSAERWNPQKRIVRVLIPYAIWTLVYVVINDGATPGKIPYDLVRCLLAASSARIMYYIFVYCELTLLIPLLDRLAQSRLRILGLVVSPLAIGLFRLTPLLMGIEVGGILGIIRKLSCLDWLVYFYLGFLLGNGYIEKPSASTRTLVFLASLSILLQVLEGYWHMSLGEANCGTQLKLSSLFTGVIVVLLAYHYLISDSKFSPGFLALLGDCSFGIYFAHLAVMWALDFVPGYAQCVPYPINGLCALFVSLAFVLGVRRVFAQSKRYLGF